MTSPVAAGLSATAVTAAAMRALREARAPFGGAAWVAPEFTAAEYTAAECTGDVLTGSDRSLVVRIPGSPPVVAKAISQADLGPDSAREPAALEVLTALGFGLSPRLLATAEDPPLIVMEDLGPGETVADALLGDSPARADASLDLWASSLGALHCQARAGLRESFQTALREHATRLGVDAPPADQMPDRMRRRATELATVLARLDLTVPPAALAELTEIPQRLGGGGAAEALTPADACPDNNITTARGLALIDFEDAQFRHVAWDAAYLTVPWPSCWCSWRMPDVTAGRALEIWRHRVAPAIGYVLTPDFDEDLRLTTVAWAISTIAMMLPAVLDDDDRPFPDLIGRMPTRRDRIADRVRTALNLSEHRLPALHRLFIDVDEATRRAWGPASLPLASAYRPN